MVRQRNDINNKIGTVFTNNLGRPEQASLAASGATIGFSGTVGSIGHVAASSKAIAGASKELDKVLTDIQENSDSDSLEFFDYIAKVERYRNHRLPASLNTCSLSASEWQRVKFAAEVSKAVYEDIDPRDNRLSIPAAWNSTTKAMTIETRAVSGVDTLVVGIRGTVTVMDWAVNANGEPADAPELGAGVVCHRGFLDVARRMDEVVTEVVNKLRGSTDGPSSLLFTGHSAGAAVAQILFAFTHSSRTKLGSLASCFKAIHCITFGGPPIAIPPIPCPTGSLFLSFINEGDPVVLAQPKYLDSLLEAYARPIQTEVTDWKLPKPYYSFSGTSIVLRDMAPDDAIKVDLQVFIVEPVVLSGVLFGNPLLHSMTEYLSRVSTLEKRAAGGVFLRGV